MQYILNVFQGDPNLSLSLASRIFVNERYRVSANFRSRALEFFRAEPQMINFDRDLEASLANINAWVEAQTNNKIRDLLQPGTIHAATKIVLVNAVYFQVPTYE